jgi:hypothetical protein
LQMITGNVCFKGLTDIKKLWNLLHKQQSSQNTSVYTLIHRYWRHYVLEPIKFSQVLPSLS